MARPVAVGAPRRGSSAQRATVVFALFVLGALFVSGLVPIVPAAGSTSGGRSSSPVGSNAVPTDTTSYVPVASGWYGWRSAAPGRRASSSETFGLYFIVHEPRAYGTVSMPKFIWDSRV
jgi:hypothetical protein